MAQKRLREKNKEAYKAEIEIPGDIRLAAGNTIELGLGFDNWGGKYMIDRIVHSIGTDGFTSTLELYRPLEDY